MVHLMNGKRVVRKMRMVWAVIAASAILMTVSGAIAAQKGAVITDALILRQKADTESKALQTLREGDTLEILSTSGDWYKVSYGRFSGYVMKKYVMAVESASSALEKAIAKLGDAPAPMCKGDTGSDVKKLQRALEIVGVYTGSIDGSFGDLTEEAVKAFQKSKRLTEDGVAGNDTIRALFFQEAAKPPEEDRGMDGINSLSDIGDAPATSELGDSGTKVKKLQQALKLKGYYSGTIDGDFGEATETAVKAFQKSRGMSRDGIAGKTTIYILFGERAANADEKNYKTEKLDWFGGGSNAVPKGATFTVKDVRTGKTFKCRRWSGYNHMDVEPLEQEDTAVMKSVFGGSWSWDRRPILVLYNGHVYACSMNGMPHGDDSVSGNNFDGHFCIHFYKSKTHATDRVDEEHQYCVNIAANAKW